MKQIEHLSAVVLCVTLVRLAEKFGRAGHVSLARLDAKQTRRAEPPRGVPSAVRSSARAASPVRVLK